MSTSIEATFTGPLFGGTAARVLSAYVEELEQAVGDMAVNEIRQALHGALRHPTGYYESNVQTERAGGDSVVNDRGVIYGPWLEGVSSRNQSTRFRGYGVFRKTTAAIEKKADEIAEELLSRKYMSELT